MKKKDIGKPTIIVHTRKGTPEEVAHNRENLRYVCQNIISELAGCPMEVEIDWDNAEKYWK